MKILAIVVTYYPEKSLLKRNINAFIEHVDKVLIWENTPELEKFKYRFIQHEKVEYCGDGINSISHALNHGWHYAKDKDYDYLLTMDQDSQWNDFDDFLKHTVNNPDTPVGVWGPFCCWENETQSINKSESIIQKYDCIITSGMLISIGIIDRIGGWNEFFDIDCVDDEFCLSANRLGINCYVIGMCKMNHHLGNPRLVKILGKTAHVPNYTYKRLYGIYKSHVVLLRMFPEVQSIRSLFLNHWLPLIKWIVVCENDRLRKFFAILGGMIKGLVCRIPPKPFY